VCAGEAAGAEGGGRGGRRVRGCDGSWAYAAGRSGGLWVPVHWQQGGGAGTGAWLITRARRVTRVLRVTEPNRSSTLRVSGTV